MKKTYFAPVMETISMNVEVSILSVSSPIGIGYGGVDEDGSKDPSVKENIFEENAFASNPFE